MTKLQADLLLFIEPQISAYRGPIYFGHKRKPVTDADIPANAGFGLVDTGEKKLLITCNHVVDGYHDAREADPDLRFYLCLDRIEKRAIAYDPLPLIDCDAGLDLAVFDVGPLLAVCRERKFYPLHQNPPPAVRSGDKIVIIGNQGVNRRVSSDGVELGESCYALNVSTVGQDGCKFRASLRDVKFEYRKSPGIPKGSPHGGISGSPCFLYTSRGLVRLVGFVCEDGMNSLLFTHARCLNRDGTLKRR